MSDIEAYLQQQTNLRGRSAYHADQPWNYGAVSYVPA